MVASSVRPNSTEVYSESLERDDKISFLAHVSSSLQFKRAAPVVLLEEWNSTNV